jgi:apolipoprotein N-acyltransferase
VNGSARGARAALAVISGLALAAAFPKVDLNLLAWVAFVPLLYAIRAESAGRVFFYAWLQGVACNIASVYWIATTLHNFTSLRTELAIAPMLLLAAIMSLYGATAFALADFSAARLRLPLVITLPVAWTALEWVRTYFPIGFPWNLLGYTAYRNLELIQFAELTGVYGISALIIFANVVIYIVAFQVYSRRIQAISLVTLTVLTAGAFVFGSIRIHGLKSAPSGGSLKIAMVQGDILQSLKWDPGFLKTSFDIYAEQSRSAASRGADLIVWPEAAAAFFFQPEDRYPPAFADDERYRQQLLALAAATADPILFGAPALGVEGGRVGFYNRAYLVSGGGQVEAWYDKIQLVPFGEYVPLRSLFGYFVNRVVTGFGDMFAGSQQTIFPMKQAKLGVLICYESIFPNLARSVVDRGANLLVNITNDAWYGDSSAPYQLLAMAAIRAVETKVPMVRVANTGISAVILPTGAITDRTPLFTRGTETEVVAWRSVRTVYTRVGDLFAEICTTLTLAGLLAALAGKRRRRRELPDVNELLIPNGRASSSGGSNGPH